MKDYMSGYERDQFMVLMSILQTFKGYQIKDKGRNIAQIDDIITDHSSRNNITKEEITALKYVRTHLNKYCESVYDRMCEKEKINIDKKYQNFDFYIISDYQFKKLKDQLKHKVLENEEYRLFCEEIMYIKCKGCTQDHKTCDLCDLFETNLVPESTQNMINCKFAYVLEGQHENM